ncbi:alpha/beta hydrolase family protein [Streptacidiphilus fuscans]|uniref:Chlorophyllase n=1 Tax=Streptacidiphilus fuscans TaxID=2789292 RepID=A0A931B737_9ACTN|nr:chlorophyllase [Streptacidiphilus fuscans]MBF9069867.1 chlorophyllase [Streptacidiphilus fuscans]MBF9073459.1 chlorophyllase [Streptacidiphilus fuscans]
MDSPTATVGPAAPVVSVHPVVLAAPGRGEDLRVRVSAPLVGDRLPVLVFSHGFGQSSDSYAPLVDFWAAHGFVVVQPTHLDSRSLGLAPDDPRQPRIWRLRVEDLVRVVDQLDLVEAAVPGLAGRVDRDRVAVAGHSWGAQTASMLLGARVLDPDGGPDTDLSDPRITAGVLLAVPGTGGDDLTPFAAEHFPFMHPGFAGMSTSALVVAGDKDQSALSVRGPEWFTDAYALSPGAESLLTLFGAEHSLGGISGYHSTETTDESPERVALVRLLTTAYLRTALGVDASAFAAARAEAARGAAAIGRVDSK